MRFGASPVVLSRLRRSDVASDNTPAPRLDFNAEPPADCTLFQPAGKKSQPEMVGLSVSESVTKELEQSGRPVRLVVGEIAILAGADCASGRLRMWPIRVPCSSAQ